MGASPPKPQLLIPNPSCRVKPKPNRTHCHFRRSHFTTQTHHAILNPMEALGSRRLSPGLYRLLVGILDMGGKQDDDIRNSFVGHQCGYSDSWLALLPEIMEE